MKGTLLVVGKTTDKHIIALVDEYLARLKHYLPTDIEVIPELRQTKALSEAQQKEAEASLILSRIQPGDRVVLLDEHGVEGDKRAEEAVKIVAAEVAKYRAGGEYADEFPDRWVPAVIAIADEPFTEQNGLVNSTMKVVRNKVEKHFEAAIAHAYTAEGKATDNARNVEAMRKLLA